MAQVVLGVVLSGCWTGFLPHLPSSIYFLTWIFKLLFFALFVWGVEFVRSSLHCFVAGVVVRWYVLGVVGASRERALASSLKRAMFFSAGSLALASLIMSAIQIPKLILKKSRASSSLFIKMCCLCCVAPCTVRIILPFDCKLTLSWQPFLDRHNTHTLAFIAAFGDAYSEASPASRSVVEASGLESFVFNSGPFLWPNL